MQNKIIIAAVVIIAAYVVYTKYIKEPVTTKGPMISPVPVEASPEEMEEQVLSNQR